ncbi:MAG: YegS/Rv2252/BmrU family lipid kinase [Chitinophagaceae bacterium]|nr:YegS/Rv2252/BmrU family lipid kinase [Chitinophagaceae bacterium]
MNRKMIVLMNPVSGSGNRSKLRKLIERRLTEKEIHFEICSTNAEGRYNNIREKIKNDGFTDVVVAGGDGTISSVVNDLRDTGVNFGLIPCGSGNGLALCAGISKNPEKAIELLFTGKPAETDAFIINNDFSCMLSGLGFDAQVAHDFAKQKERGLVTYVKQTYANFLKAKPYSFEIITQESTIKTDAFFISIANSNQFGNSFTIAPKASLNDGLLDIVVVQKMNKLQMLLSVLYQVLNGEVKERPYKKDGVMYYQAPHVVINNPQNAPLHIDGDPKETALSFTIRIIPRAFRLIQPALNATATV